MQEELKLINMHDVEASEVHWLWYPYIPAGKITIIQGDPGDGKTTMILGVAAAVTNGLLLPESKTIIGPANVIYQTAEDGLNDTIKPRLVQAGADCKLIDVIDETKTELTLSDVRIEQAITAKSAKLFIVDPLQAYLGAGVDMHRANEIRPVFKRLGLVAEKTGCAVVIVGHMNKGGGKSQYRGLGSIDIPAAARSVLTVGRIKDKPHLRAFAQGKSNLAPEGASIAFELNPESGFRWVGAYPITIDELLRGGGSVVEKVSALDRAKNFLKELLSDNAFPTNEVIELAGSEDISKRTLERAKSELVVRSFKRDDIWHWTLMPEEERQDRQQCHTENLAVLAALQSSCEAEEATA